MTAFIVEKASRGTWAQKLDKLGMRGSNTYPLFFDDCEVPPKTCSAASRQRQNVLMSGLDYERAVLSGGPLGIMAAAWMSSCPTCTTQAVRGHRRIPADAGQGRRHVLRPGNACRAYVYAVGPPATAPTMHARCARTPPAPSSTRPKGDLDGRRGDPDAGGVGYTNEYPTGRLWRDANSTKSAPAPPRSAAC